MAVWVLHGSLLHSVLERGDFLNAYISQGSVAMHLIVVGSLIIILLEIYWRIYLSVKEFWKWLRFDGVTVTSLVSSFFGTTCTCHMSNTVRWCVFNYDFCHVLNSGSAFSMWCMQGVMISIYSTLLVMLSSTAATSFDAQSTFYNNYWVIVKRGGIEMVQVIPWRRTLASSP